jgi:hypothetical protein
MRARRRDAVQPAKRLTGCRVVGRDPRHRRISTSRAVAAPNQDLYRLARNVGVVPFRGEITMVSRQALPSGAVSMVIATPVRALSQQLVDEAVTAVRTGGGELSRPEALPFDIVISGNAV